MTTPAMGLALPTPSLTQGIGIAAPGQSWGEQYNSNFTTLDTHTHAPGSGSPVPTSGIAINADLTFAGFNATNLRTTQFSGIALGALGVADRNCLLASSGDLYFVDGSGNQVRMTSGGGVAGTPGAITGLASPAAVTYTVGAKLFTFTSSTPRVAGIACGPLSIGDATVDNGKQVTISAPAGLVANYAMTLPTGLPGSDGLMRLSTTGALSAFGTIASSVPTFPAGLTLSGALTLAAGSTAVQVTLAAGFLVLQGNLAAAGAGADVVLNSTATRSANLLAQVQNNGVGKLDIDFQGLARLTSQAAPIQPSSIYTAITPNTNVVANQGAAYWKDSNGIVHLKGILTNGTGGPTINLMTTTPLPAGFRPAFIRDYVVSDQAGGTNSISVTAGGSIQAYNAVPNLGAVSLDGISFPAEQ